MAQDERGFAAMPEKQQRAVASQGGQAAQASGRAHTLTEEERSKGGQRSGGNFANNPQRASRAGREGGRISH